MLEQANTSIFSCGRLEAMEFGPTSSILRLPGAPAFAADTNKDFKNISAPTASRDLKWAVEQGILSKFGEQSLTQYKFT